MDPKFAGLPWATTVNYPAGAFGWSSQPTKITPAYTFFTPSAAFAPSAPELNAMFNQRDGALLELYAKTRANEALNWNLDILAWSSGIAGLSKISWYPPAWDAYGCRWLVGGQLTAGSANHVWQSLDGSLWSQLDSSGFTDLIDDIAVRPSDGRAVAIEVCGRKTSRLVSASGTSWAETVLNAGGGTTTGQARIVCFGNRFVAAYNIDGAVTPVLRYADDGFTWTAISGSAAGALGSGTKGGAFVAGDTALLFFGILSGNDSGSLGTTYGYSTDGITWLQRTLPAFATSTECILGACYDGTSKIFYVLYVDPSWNAGLGRSRVLSSTDGLAWDLTRPFVPRTMSGLAANGCTLVSNVVNVNGGIDRVVVSTDDAQTWGGSGLLRATSSAGGDFRASGTQFLFHDRVNARFAWSTIAGLPPTLKF